MGENDKGKAGSVLKEGQGIPLLLSTVASLVAVLEFGLQFSEPTGVRASCVHTTCAESQAVQENSVLSMYCLRVSSF